MSTLIELNYEEKKNLISLIAKQDLKIIRTIPLNNYNLNFYIEDKDIHFDRKITPLLSACYVGKVDTVILLLINEYIDVNMESENEGYTPLMVSCFKGYFEITRLLLERKADVNKKNKIGQVPIVFCFSRLEEDFYKYENKKICIMLIDLLLSKGADINTVIDINKGWTILMKLASIEVYDKERYSNTVEIIKFLIERGADKEIKAIDGSNIYQIIKESEYKFNLMNIIKNTSYLEIEQEKIKKIDLETDLRSGNCNCHIL